MDEAETPRPPHDDVRDAAAPGRPTVSALPRRRFSPRLRAGLVLIALYSAIACVLPADLFWSPDEGAKFLQLAGYHGRWPRLEQRVPYGGRPLDPRYRFYPQPLPTGHRFHLVSQLYPRPAAAGRVETNWPPLFPLLSRLPFAVFGFRGLHLLPIAAGVGTALLAGAISRRIIPRAEIPVMIAIGLCTPVLFYSTLFWEHTLGVAFGVAALALCIRGPRLSPLDAIAASACLILAIALRLEMVVLAGSVAVALIAQPVLRRSEAAGDRRWKAASAAAFATMAGAAFALLAARHSQTLGFGGAKESSLIRQLVDLLASPRLWRELPIRIQRGLIDLPADTGPTLDPWIAWLGVLGVLVAVASLAFREPVRGWMLVAGGGLLTLVSLLTVLSPERFRSVHALLLPAPYAVFALLALPAIRAADQRARGIFGATVAVTMASSAVLSLPLLIGGLEWGNRYHLIFYVLTATACVTGVMLYSAAPADQRRPRVAMAAVAGLALAVGGLYQIRGLRELAVSKADLYKYRGEIAAASVPVVSDLYWLPGSLADAFRRIPLFTLRDPDQLAAWIDAIGDRRPQFLIVTDVGDPSRFDSWSAGATPHSIELGPVREIAGLWFLDATLQPLPRPGPS